MQRLLSESGCYIAGTLVPLCSPVSRSELLWNVPSPWRKLQWHFHRSCWMTFQMSECSVVTWTVWMMQLLSTNEIYTANNTSPQVFELPRYLGTWPKWPNLAFRGPFSGFQVKICFRMFSQMDVSKNHCSHLSSCEYMWIIYHWGYPVEAVGWATRYCWPSPHFHSNLTKGAVSAEKHVAMDKSSHIELSQNQDRTEQLCVCFRLYQHNIRAVPNRGLVLNWGKDELVGQAMGLRLARARLHQRDGQGLPVLLVCRSQRHAEQRQCQPSGHSLEQRWTRLHLNGRGNNRNRTFTPQGSEDWRWIFRIEVRQSGQTWSN